MSGVIERRAFLERLSILSSAAVFAGCGGGAAALLPKSTPQGDLTTETIDGVKHTMDSTTGNQTVTLSNGDTIAITTSGSTVTATATSNGVTSTVLTASANAATGLLVFEGAAFGSYTLDCNAMPTSAFEVAGHTITPSTSVASISGPTVVGSTTVLAESSTETSITGLNQGYRATQIYAGDVGVKGCTHACPLEMHRDVSVGSIGGVILSGIGFVLGLVGFAAAIIAGGMAGLVIAGVALIVALIALVWSIIFMD